MIEFIPRATAFLKSNPVSRVLGALASLATDLAIGALFVGAIGVTYFLVGTPQEMAIPVFAIWILMIGFVMVASWRVGSAHFLLRKAILARAATVVCNVIGIVTTGFQVMFVIIMGFA